MKRRGKRADRISSAEEAERAVNDWIELVSLPEGVRVLEKW